jgi:gluconate 5-dehydrogenase
MGRLDGRHAVVTASGGKMGAAIALRLAAEGCDVALNDLDGRLTAAYAEQVRALGRDAIEVAGDVSQRADAEALIDAAIDRWGGVDILVNNVGGSTGPYVQDILAITDEDWDATMLLNTRATFICSQLVVPGMIERGGGKIVNVCSVLSEVARETIGPYGVSKGALKLLTQSMCADWARHGIQANGIGPGYFRTELNDALQADPEFDAWLRRRVPAGRWGEPSELAGAAIFLASAASDFVNGQILYVDGGLLAVV